MTNKEDTEMKLESIFEKDIHRNISGVIKVQDTDESKAWTVLDEYVVTPEIEKLLALFYSSYNASIDSTTDEIGCWISGFFGSGKSHFLEILNHLLANKPIPHPTNNITKTPLEFFKDKKVDSFLLADIGRAAALDSDTILFNIDNKSETKDGDYAILNVFVRVFNGLQGYFEKNPWVAEFERKLTAENVYEAFQEAFHKNAGKGWKDNRDAVLLNRPHIIKALTDVLPKISKEDAAAWFENLKSKHSLSPEEFAKLVKAYLDSKGPKARVIFLVDEVGQFIGENTSKMLQLQTITEQLGITCKGKAWVVVTSQEDVDKVLGSVSQSRSNDFSKIQGRFKTRLSLSSSNVDEVIKLRILKKKEQAAKTLAKIYQDNESILKNLLGFTGEGTVMPFYKDAIDFAATYPFVTYQFQILQQVYTTIRQTGATGKHLAHGERSMINAFQLAAKMSATSDAGKLIPFYYFYDSIENSLDGSIKATIAKASTDKTLTSEFDVSLLKLLFLLRNLDRDIPPNVDNLATLCVNHISTDKLELKISIEASLTRLEKQNFIRRNDDLYFFLSDQEQEIEREIQHTEVDSTRTAKQLFSLIFEDVFEVKSAFNYKPLKRVYDITRRCDNYTADRQGDDLSFTVVTPFFDGYADFAAKPEQISILQEGTALLILDQDKAFDTEFNVWLKTEKFLETPKASQAPERERIIQEIRGINNNRRDRLRKILEPILLQSPIYIKGIQWKASNIKKPKELYDQTANYLVENTYNRLHLIKASTEDFDRDLRLILSESDTSKIFEENMLHPQATETIKNYIISQQGRALLLADLVDRFERKPFGWRDQDIVLILSRLVVKGDLELRTDAPLLPREAFPFLQKKPNWRTIRVTVKQKVSSEVLRAVQTIAKDWFEVSTPSDDNELFSLLRDELHKLNEKLISYESSAKLKSYPGLKTISEGRRLVELFLELKEQSHLFSALSEKKNEIQSFRDAFQDVADFYAHQVGNWEQLQEIISRASLNATYLIPNEQAQQVLKVVESIISSENPFSQLKDSHNLSKQFKEIEDSLINQYRAFADKNLQESMKAIQALLSENANKLNKVPEEFLAPIQRLADEIKDTNVLSTIEIAGLKSKDLAVQQAKLIREAIKPVSTGNNEEPSKAVSNQYLKLSDLQPLGKALTSTEEVNSFVDRVQSQLLEAVKKGPVYID